MPKFPSPSERVLDDWSDSMTAPKEMGGLDAFKTWSKSRVNSASLLDMTKAPGSDDKAPTLTTRLNTSGNPTQAAIVRAAVFTAFETANPLRPGAAGQPSDAIEKAQLEFERDFKLLKNAITNVPSMIEVRDLPEYLKLIEEEALKNIKTVQKEEVAELKKELNLPATLTAMKDALGINDAEAKAMAAHLITTLETSHKEANKKFEEAMSKSRETLNTQIAQDRTRIAVLQRMDADNEKIAAQIARLQQKNNPQALSVWQGRFKGKFRGIRPRDLQGLVTIEGRGITIDRDSKDNTVRSYKLEPNKIGDRFKSLARTLTGKDKDLNDLISLAAVMRADGVENVTMTIKGTPDKETALRLARKTYQACILAGYPPAPSNSIRIQWYNDKGELETLCGKPDDKKSTYIPASDKLFTGHLNDTLLAIHKQGDAIRQSEAGSVKSLKSTQELRQQLENLRNSPPPAVTPRRP